VIPDTRIDYAIAKRRCDDVLNPHYKAWLTHGEADLSAPRTPSGTWDWMVGVYKQSPKYTGKGTETRSSYDRMLALVSKYILKAGRLFGTLALASITPGAADKLFEKLKANPGRHEDPHGRPGDEGVPARLGRRKALRASPSAIRKPVPENGAELQSKANAAVPT
jgi:hypothetical protein